MSHGEHTHKWKYGEPKSRWSSMSQEFYWKVYRFCTECLEGEEILLKDVNNHA